MDGLKRDTIKDYTAWDLNADCVKSDPRLKRKIKRKARRKNKRNLKKLLDIINRM